MTWDEFNSGAPGLTALAAILAVIVGPAVQSWGAVKQGRSQAIGGFTTEIMSTCVNEVAYLIENVAKLYKCSPIEKDELRSAIFIGETKIQLLIGRGSSEADALGGRLEAIRVAAFKEVRSEDIEVQIADLKARFAAFLAAERGNIRRGR